MLIVLEIGKTSKKWNKHEVEACVQSILYAWHNLHIDFDTTIEVEFLPKHKTYVGLTNQDSLKKYRITMYYNEAGIKAMMTTIMHEMVHVKQFRSRSLSYEPLLMWHDGTFYNEVPYPEQPWEIEAYKLEKILIKKLLK